MGQTFVTDAERCATLALLLTAGLGPTLVGRCLEAFGSAEATLGQRAAAFAGLRGISPRQAEHLRHELDAVLTSGAVEQERADLEALGGRLLHVDEADYPALLRSIPDPPPLLWMRGRLTPADQLTLGIVGSRKCTHYGREQADRFAAGCCTAGLTIVSGGAYGVDIAAHRATLRVRGRTVAVLGSGLSNVYPADHRDVFDRIVQDDAGAVLSELPLRTGPQPKNFPRRNRIISGLSLGVLVIESALRSGALITARVCVEDHGRDCFALPGRVDSPASAGCHDLIRRGGATLVTSPGDVLEALGDMGTTLEAAAAMGPLSATDAQGTTSGGGGGGGGGALFEATVTAGQAAILEALAEPRSLDQLVAWLKVPAGGLQADLTLLELRRRIERQGGLFRRRG